MSINDIKVIIVGLDPYSTNDANGYAFATDKNIKPISLKNIEKGIINNLKLTNDYFLQNNLSHLINQGVFLLNTGLTVTKGKPKSHLDYWKNLIKFTFNTLNNVNDKKLIFIFLGSDAQKNAKFITNHICLFAEHPARCSYEEREFEHNNIFSNTNRFLSENNQKEIIWVEKQKV